MLLNITNTPTNIVLCFFFSVTINYRLEIPISNREDKGKYILSYKSSNK